MSTLKDYLDNPTLDAKDTAVAEILRIATVISKIGITAPSEQNVGALGSIYTTLATAITAGYTSGVTLPDALTNEQFGSLDNSVQGLYQQKSDNDGYKLIDEQDLGETITFDLINIYVEELRNTAQAQRMEVMKLLEFFAVDLLRSNNEDYNYAALAVNFLAAELSSSQNWPSPLSDLQFNRILHQYSKFMKGVAHLEHWRESLDLNDPKDDMGTSQMEIKFQASKRISGQLHELAHQHYIVKKEYTGSTACEHMNTEVARIVDKSEDAKILAKYRSWGKIAATVLACCFVLPIPIFMRASYKKTRSCNFLRTTSNRQASRAKESSIDVIPRQTL